VNKNCFKELANTATIARAQLGSCGRYVIFIRIHATNI